MNPSYLVDIARTLATGAVSGSRGRPRQTDLCRAVSAAYYAMFHALANSNADTLVGNANRRRQSWRQTYRALEHGEVRRRCSNLEQMRAFPLEIQEFGKNFVAMQRLRHTADYDPDAQFTRFQVLDLTILVEDSIAALDSAEREAKHSFAIYILLRQRNA